MSGHSKWSKVKHQKESTDAVKGKLFTKASAAIIIAVREGGGIIDPNSNFKLRLAIEKARGVNMPKDNIERAIARGCGEGEGESLAPVLYEAFGPGGTTFLIEGATDNIQRTTANVKNVLERGGGRLSSPGSVSYLFSHVGQIVIPKNNMSFDDIMVAALDAGGDDVFMEGDFYIVETKPNNLHKVLVNLQERQIPIESSELVYRPKAKLHLQLSQEKQVLSLLENLEVLDDIHKVFTNAVFSNQ